MSVWVAIAATAAALLVAARLRGGRSVPSTVVLEKIRAGAHVVDVRTPEEFRRGAYPGAVNVPLLVLAAHLDDLPRDRPIVVYCASGMRSASAVRLLQRAGFGDVVNAGGLRRMPP